MEKIIFICCLALITVACTGDKVNDYRFEERKEKLPYKAQVFFSYSDSLASYATSSPLGKYKDKALSIEETNLDTSLEWISFSGMKATTNADNSMALLTLPTEIDDDLKEVICSVASKQANDARIEKKAYYFVDCPAD